MTIENIAEGLTQVLGEQIIVQDGSIALQGADNEDYALLQIGANDGALYFSAPIKKIEVERATALVLRTLMELNSDTKNYPFARVAYNPAQATADWIERCESDINPLELLELIRSRGILITRIRQALSLAAEK